MGKKSCPGYVFLLLLLVIVGVTGCSSAKKEAVTKEEKTETEKGNIQLYYLNAEENGFTTVEYSLENPGDPLLASYEVIYKLSDTESHSTSDYKPAIFDGVVVNSIVISNGEETIDMGAGYRQLSASREILLRSAIVRSLLQINDVESVRFTINGDSLLGSDDMPVGAMDKNSFILGGEEEKIYNDKEQVVLYYANPEGDGLVEYKTVLQSKGNIPMETTVLEALKTVPGEVDGLSPLPGELKINQTQVRNNVCYVDLSREIENILPGVEEKVMVYAMVNSITSLGNAASVQFTVEGKRMDTLRDFDSFHLLLTNDYSLSEGKRKSQ